MMLDKFAQKIRKRAVKAWGSAAQIRVASEELAELIAVLMKTQRYSDAEHARKDMYDKILDEYCDACIMLPHVREIFGLTEEDIARRTTEKLLRVERWLDTGIDLSVSTKVR